MAIRFEVTKNLSPRDLSIAFTDSKPQTTSQPVISDPDEVY
jgi:hypothetical protein